MLTITDAASETMNRLDMTDPFLKAGDQVESRESSASRLCRNDHGPPIHRRTHLRFFLKLIYDTALIGLTFLSPDCRRLQINQRLTEICGISVEDRIGCSVRDCVPALAEAVDESTAPYQEVRSFILNGAAQKNIKQPFSKNRPGG
jgi:PAS domain-containing protein